MDIKGNLWEHATWIDFFERQNEKWTNVEYFCEKFDNVLKFDENIFECLYQEFLEYRTLKHKELPDPVFEEALILEDSQGNEREYRMDVIWYHIG